MLVWTGTVGMEGRDKREKTRKEVFWKMSVITR